MTCPYCGLPVFGGNQWSKTRFYCEHCDKSFDIDDVIE